MKMVGNIMFIVVNVAGSLSLWSVEWYLVHEPTWSKYNNLVLFSSLTHPPSIFYKYKY